MDLTDDPLATVDADELEADIDKAIDELFVQKSAAAAAPKSEPAPAPEPEQKPQAPAEPKPQPAPAAQRTVELLGPLKESLLTLDWEINSENIRAFEQELLAVSEKLGDDRHSMAIVKMTTGVLKYLHAAKGSATPISIQFVHSATRGLDLFQREPSPTEAERSQVMDKLLGQFRRLKAEIQRLKPPPFPAAAEEAPAASPDPVAEPLHPEARAQQQPAAAPPLAEGPVLEPVPEEEPLIEELPYEETFVEPETEEEPLVEELPYEETFVEPEEEPLIEELPYEETFVEPVPEEEPFVEPSAKAAEAAPRSAPGVQTDDDAPEPWQQLTREARDNSRQLSDALAKLVQQSGDFFGSLMNAVAGKPALEKVENHFIVVRQTMREKLLSAQSLAGNLAEAMTKLEQSLGRQQLAAHAASAQEELALQVKTVREAMQRMSRAVSDLEQGLSGSEIDRANSMEEQGRAGVSLDTAELFSEPEGAMDTLDSEPFLDLVEELPPEPSGPALPSQGAIYLTNVASNTLAIPTEAVANVFKISKGKAKALRKKGHARLTDFKALFGSLKRGLTGPLANQPVKALKRIQFPIITLSPEILGRDEILVRTPARGIVLLSNGERHGALLTDEVMQRTPYEVLGYRRAGLPGEVSGTATIEGDFEINVIDPDYVLS